MEKKKQLVYILSHGNIKWMSFYLENDEFF